MSAQKLEDNTVIVAIYLRLSEEDSNKLQKVDDSESIRNQRSMLVNYAMKNRWEIYDIYSDDDFSGADEAIARPEFERLMADARKGVFNVVLAKTQSRFTRNSEYVEKIIHKEFFEMNIRFIGLVDNIDTSQKGTKKTSQISGLVNEWYVEDLSANIKAVFDTKKQQGKFVGAFAPYGYTKDPKDKNHFLVDEPAARVVRLIFKLYLDGLGLTRVAQHLNDLGYPCPAEYKRLQGLNYIPRQRGKQGRMWRGSSINSIIKNQMYTGDMVQGKSGTISYKNSTKKRINREDWVIVPDQHAAIIDRDTFLKVASIAKNRTKPEKTGKRHIFAGKIKCATCGSCMIKHHANKGNRYFNCPMGKYDICSNPAHVTYNLVYEAVYNELRQMFDMYSNADDLAKLIQAQDVSISRRQQIEQQLAQAKLQSIDADRALEQLYLDKIKGVVSEDQFVTLSRVIAGNSDTLKRQVKTLQKEIKEFEVTIDRTKEKQTMIKKYTDMTELSREIVDEFVDEILIQNTKLRGIKEITIKWNI